MWVSSRMHTCKQIAGWNKLRVSIITISFHFFGSSGYLHCYIRISDESYREKIRSIRSSLLHPVCRLFGYGFLWCICGGAMMHFLWEEGGLKLGKYEEAGIFHMDQSSSSTLANHPAAQHSFLQITSLNTPFWKTCGPLACKLSFQIYYTGLMARKLLILACLILIVLYATLPEKLAVWLPNMDAIH